MKQLHLHAVWTMCVLVFSLQFLKIKIQVVLTIRGFFVSTVVNPYSLNFRGYSLVLFFSIDSF